MLVHYVSSHPLHCPIILLCCMQDSMLIDTNHRESEFRAGGRTVKPAVGGKTNDLPFRRIRVPAHNAVGPLSDRALLELHFTFAAMKSQIAVATAIMMALCRSIGRIKP